MPNKPKPKTKNQPERVQPDREDRRADADRQREGSHAPGRQGPMDRPGRTGGGPAREDRDERQFNALEDDE